MLPQRKSPRLQGYDYSQAGTYFVTICTHRMQHLFGEIVVGAMELNALGHTAAACWLALPLHLPAFELDSFVVMPNHIHGIVSISSPQLSLADADKRAPSLSLAINQYKSAVTKYGRQIVGTIVPDPL